MTSMTTLAEAEAELAKYVPLTKEITGKDITLERMKPLMEAFGNPQEKLKVIHIAGTSGKTSTAYYIASLLTLAGRKTGLTVSPHVDSVLERIQINLGLLDENEFASKLGECMEIVEAMHLCPTYFELLTAFAYWYFAKAGVDYAVIETGLGGLHDATNIAGNPDKICVITDIGLDHMHILGETVAQIARQKAGIIHLNNTVLMYEQDDEIMNAVLEACKTVQAELNTYDQKIIDENFDVSSLPGFQQRNWLLAYETYKLLAVRDGLPELSAEKLGKSTKLHLPGRMDEIRIDNKLIIMDGAHNEQKTESFVGSFMQKYPGIKVPVLLSLKEGKEFAAVIPLLKKITSKLIITTFEHTMDLPAYSIDPHELLVVAQKFGISSVVAEPDQQKAYEMLLDEPNDMAVITGSFYLLGQLRSKHRELSYAGS